MPNDVKQLCHKIWNAVYLDILHQNLFPKSIPLSYKQAYVDLSNQCSKLIDYTANYYIITHKKVIWDHFVKVYG